MIQGRFAHTLNDMRGLIDGWSAPSVSDSNSCGRVLLAVSGGIDSMCMAELFASVSDDFPFAVAHCNFNLRG
jgi:tRNA(Ile)-lysidine synthase TilS/MesJ